MPDIENDVIDYVGNALRTTHSGIDVSGTYVNAPSTFPHVSIVESDSRVVKSARTYEKIENATYLMYECNIYSNKVSGKKQEAKAIANTLDEAFHSIGFVRTFRNPIPNINDATIYRIVCRYDGVVAENDDGKIYVYNEY